MRSTGYCQRADDAEDTTLKELLLRNMREEMEPSNTKNSRQRASRGLLVARRCRGGDQGPTLHLHAVLGKPDGSVVGGRLIEANIRPTLEVILIQPPSCLRKRRDPETGLALIDIA
jgi:hypothetical protein